MVTIEVNEEYSMSKEAVWEKITDHASYKSYAALQDSLLVKEGESEKNGLKAVRKIVPNDKMYFLEEITAFDKYARFEYFIFETSAPIKHHGGVVRLEETESGCKINWVSKFDMAEGTRPAMERAIKSSSTKMFQEILVGVKKTL
ncbi:MAG: SRPBCC family protein [Spirochaetota bacterium]